MHNSDRLVCLEKKENSAIANIITFSKTDPLSYRIVGATLYSIMYIFPQISRGNLYPYINISYRYEILNLETSEVIDVSGALGGEFLISRSGNYAFISASGITRFNIATRSLEAEALGNPSLQSIHLLDSDWNGEKILFVGQRSISASTSAGSITNP
jgi:hypothetical protein